MERKQAPIVTGVVVTTSAASPGSARPIVLDFSESLPARVWGTLFSPRRTFRARIRTPKSADVLLVSFAAAFVAGAALLQTEVGQLALVDSWERTAIALGQPIGDAEYETLQRASRYGIVYSAVTAFARGPLLAVGLAAALLPPLRRRVTTSFRQVLTLTAHASVILALRQVIGAPISYARESLVSPATPALFVPALDEGSPVTRFLGLIDLFVVWWLLALAIGLAELSGRPLRRVALWCLGGYVVLAGALSLGAAVVGELR
jgi:hypothetical protein